MTTIIGIFGKGGTGKTTVTALLLKALLDKKEESKRKNNVNPEVMSIDADPNICLPYVLGIREFRTLADQIEEFRGKTVDIKLFETKFQMLLLENEQRGYDLLVMGKGELGGCYCYINNLLKSLMTKHVLIGGYSYDIILIDCEAGLEHISRKTSCWVDNVIIVTDPSEISLRTSKRIKDMVLKVSEIEKVRLGEIYLICNMQRNVPESEYPQIEQRIRNYAQKIGVKYMGLIPFDEKIQEFNIAGKSLLEIPKDSKAHAQILKLLEEIVGT